MSPNSSHQTEHCNFPEANSMSTALFVAYLSLLPLFLFVAFVGFQRWRKHRSGSAAAASSHSDVLTYNLVTLEVISVASSCFYNFGIYANKQDLKEVGMHLFSMIAPGQTMFQVLTCVDRYLAVVYPITYLGLRRRGGVRIRNASITCVWLNCVAMILTMSIFDIPYTSISCFFFAVSSIIVSFCSVSVLCVLIRPKPGEGGGNKGRVDQSKQRAFNTMAVVTGVLLLRFFTSLLSLVLQLLLTSLFAQCLVSMAFIWFHVPSSLVLPLLFLQRVGKLGFCKQKPVRAA